MQQRPCLQPVEQALAVGRVDDRSQDGIGLAPLGVAARERQQVQVVIAEHDDRGVAQARDEPQHAERIGPAIDEVADEPEAVARGIEREAVEQRLAVPRRSPARRRWRRWPRVGLARAAVSAARRASRA